MIITDPAKRQLKNPADQTLTKKNRWSPPINWPSFESWKLTHYLNLQTPAETAGRKSRRTQQEMSICPINGNRKDKEENKRTDPSENKIMKPSNF